jgi:hypothetical protein
MLLVKARLPLYSLGDQVTIERERFSRPNWSRAQGEGKVASLVNGPTASCPCFCFTFEYSRRVLAPHIKAWCAMAVQCKSWLVWHTTAAQCGVVVVHLLSCATWAHGGVSWLSSLRPLSPGERRCASARRGRPSSAGCLPS